MLIFKGKKVLEPDKSSFLSIIFFAPVFICFIGYPLIAKLPALVVNYTMIIALVLNYLAYNTICDLEHIYRCNQTKEILLASLNPLPEPSVLRGVHKVFKNEFATVENRKHAQFADFMCECLGLNEFARLVGDCRVVGNMLSLIHI